MNKLRFYLLALAALVVFSVRADEGMWLLQLMQQQHSIDMMKKQGLKLEAQDLYNPNGVSLKDAVGIFGGGCIFWYLYCIIFLSISQSILFLLLVYEF